MNTLTDLEKAQELIQYMGIDPNKDRFVYVFFRCHPHAFLFDTLTGDGFDLDAEEKCHLSVMHLSDCWYEELDEHDWDYEMILIHDAFRFE